MNVSSRWRQVAAVLAAVFALLGVGVVVSDGGGGSPDRITITAPPAATPDAALSNGDPVPEDLRGNLRGNDSTSIASARGARLERWPGCWRHAVRSFSSRISNVRAVAIHYAVFPNLTGLDDLDRLTAFADNPANGASWHFLIDAEGHCYYSVPVGAKAWTIAGLNSQTVNIEVVERGDEGGVFAGGGPGTAKLRRVVRRIAKLFGLPLRLAATDGHCNVTRTGILTHWMGGPCSGGHHDILPWRIRRVVRRIAST